MKRKYSYGTWIWWICICLLPAFTGCRKTEAPPVTLPQPDTLALQSAVQDTSMDTIAEAPAEEEIVFTLTQMSCEEGRALAQKDRASGKLGYMMVGERDDHYFDQALSEEYGIKVYSKSCMMEPGFECYNEIMEPLILKKFGNDIFDKVADKAALLREGIDHKAAFPGGMEALTPWLKDHFQYPPDAPDSLSGKVKVYVVIDTAGKVSYAGIREGVHPLIDAECLRVIKSMPAWEPASLEGHPKTTDMMIPFVIKGK